MPTLTGRQVALIAGCILALVVVGTAIFGLVRGPADPSTADTTTVPTVNPPAHGTSAPSTAARPSRRLPHTTDPLTYTDAAARSLFDWDTTTGLLPADYSDAVLSDADPSGEETPGLVTDVATYLPTTQQWLDLAAMDVVQRIDITHAYTPTSWSTALQESRGQLRPGTTAVTIDATRDRTGVWSGKVAATSSPVSFTVFVACPPTFDRCHILRLSQLDNPLR